MARNRAREAQLRQQIVGTASAGESDLITRIAAIEAVLTALRVSGPIVIWAATATAGSPDMPGALLLASGGDISLDFVTVPGQVRLNVAPGAVIDNDIAADTITFQKLNNIATARVLGRVSASTGDIEELTISQALDLVSSTQGTILYRGASGWAALAPSTVGHALLTQGAGADPVWAGLASITL